MKFLPLLALLLTTASAAWAQVGTDPAYTGPRFPGGPDSLRAYLRRHPLPAAAGKGPVFVQFDVLPLHRRNEPHLLLPPGRAALSPAGQAAVWGLLAQLPDWEPGRQDVETPITTVTLCLNDPQQSPAALSYADTMPEFAEMKPGIIGLYQRMAEVYTVDKTVETILAQKLQGDAYVYFEVAETGQVEHVHILNGDHPLLVRNALQTMSRLPQKATRPARLAGRPVRVYYVLSMGVQLN
jgi:protein TonB